MNTRLVLLMSVPLMAKAAQAQAADVRPGAAPAKRKAGAMKRLPAFMQGEVQGVINSIHDPRLLTLFEQSLAQMGGGQLAKADGGVIHPFTGATLFSTQSAHDYAHHAPVHSGLTDPQRASLHHYSALGYKAINGALREGRPEDPEAAPHLSHLDSAVHQHVVGHEHGVVAFRGLHSGFMRSMLEQHQAGKLIGSVHKEPGYTSTTLDHGQVHNFGLNHIDLRRPTLMTQVIHLPKGMRGLPMAPHSKHPQEAEMLLPRGTMLKHIGVETRDMDMGHVFHVMGKQERYGVQPEEDMKHVIVHSVAAYHPSTAHK